MSAPPQHEARTAVVFMSFNPSPPRSGLHRRCLELIDGLRALGYRVVVASAYWTDPAGWAGCAPSVDRLGWADGVRLYEAGRWDQRGTRVLVPLARALGRQLPLAEAPFVPLRMRRWFSDLAVRLAADLVVVVHAHWDALLDHRRLRRVPRVMETIDLVSLNARLWSHLNAHLPPEPADPADAEPAVLDERFFERAAIEAAPEEFRVYDRYSATIAISEAEATAISCHTRRTRVGFLPMTMAPVARDNRYDGGAFFPTGPNPFNVQGYLYFAARVLPLVRRDEPAFRLDVTGYCDATRVVPQPGITLHGWVDDLAPLYSEARMMVSPVFGGTGQQVKIVEAMANGLPVVALREAAARSPLVHDVNGLVADDAATFAAHVVRLWRDPALRRRLGDAARETIAREYSHERFTADLAALLRAASP